MEAAPSTAIEFKINKSNVKSQVEYITHKVDLIEENVHIKLLASGKEISKLLSIANIISEKFGFNKEFNIYYTDSLPSMSCVLKK